MTVYLFNLINTISKLFAKTYIQGQQTSFLPL